MTDETKQVPSLAELRAMLRAATPGPWLLETSAGGYMPSIIQSDRRQIVCLTGQAPMTDPEGRPVTELMMANARLVAEMHAAILPLLELAEAYLAVRALDALPASEIPNRPIGEYRHALDRLYAAAKQVRP